MITGLQLKNFLAFRDIKCQFRRLTVLAGTNSAGKSTLLHGLAVLRQSHIAGTLPETILLNGPLVRLGVGRDVLHSDFADLSNDGAITFEIAIGTSRGRRSWSVNYIAGSDGLEVRSHPPVDENPPELFGRGFQYLCADRVAPDVTFPKSHLAVGVERWLGTRGEYTANFLLSNGHEFVANRMIRHEQALSGALLDQTNAWLRELTPDVLLEIEDVQETDLVRLVFRRGGGQVRTERQRATNVGFGLTFCLPIIVACLAAERGSLLLIENPEAHMHPHGQAVMGRLCALAAAGGTQVVVETHSDHVLNAVRVAVKNGVLNPGQVALQFLTRQVGVVEPTSALLPINGEGMVQRWPPGFFDESERALDELLR